MTRRSVPGIRVFVLFVLAGTAGCYTYVPVANPAPGTQVRVHVPVTSALADPNAAPQTAAIEGEVVSFQDTLRLATTSRQEYGAYREVVMYDTLSLAPDQRVVIEQPEFSRGRTIVLTSVIVGGATLLALAAFSGTFGGNQDPTDPGPPTPQGAVTISNSLVSGVLGILGFAR